VSTGVSSRAEPGRIGAGRTVAMTWQRARSRSDDRAARLLRAAERDAEAAAARYRALKEAAAAPAPGDGARRPMPSWQQMLLLVIGGGILTGLLVIWLLATAYLAPAALLSLPAGAGVAAGFIALRRRRPRPAASRRRPLVADLVRAAQEMHEAEAVLQRLRQQGS
jgi:hypothetical protein